MTTYRPFSADRLCHIRRLRKARRLFKQAPLFAFAELCSEYAGYTYEQFLDDLRPRTRKAKRRSKSPLVRFGRYHQMQKLLCEYEWTKVPETALKAIQLRRLMTKPYRILVRFSDCRIEYSLSPLLPIQQIAQLTERLNSCANQQQATAMVEAFRENHRIAG